MAKRDVKQAELAALDSAKDSLQETLKALPRTSDSSSIPTEVELQKLKGELMQNAQELEVLKSKRTELKSRLETYKKARDL